MKIVWPLLYVAFATVMIAGPGYAVTKILDAKPVAVAPPAKAVAAKQAASEEPIPDPSRRPVWIVATPEYRYATPTVTPRVVTREIRDAKDASNSAKKPKAEKPRLSPAPSPQAALSFAEETPAPASLPIGRD